MLETFQRRLDPEWDVVDGFWDMGEWLLGGALAILAWRLF